MDACGWPSKLPSRRDKMTIAAVVLLGGIVWLAVAREPAWPGWSLVGVGAAWMIAALRR